MHLTWLFSLGSKTRKRWGESHDSLTHIYIITNLHRINGSHSLVWSSDSFCEGWTMNYVSVFFSFLLFDYYSLRNVITRYVRVALQIWCQLRESDWHKRKVNIKYDWTIAFFSYSIGCQGGSRFSLLSVSIWFSVHCNTLERLVLSQLSYTDSGIHPWQELLCVHHLILFSLSWQKLGSHLKKWRPTCKWWTNSSLCWLTCRGSCSCEDLVTLACSFVGYLKQKWTGLSENLTRSAGFF